MEVTTNFHENQAIRSLLTFHLGGLLLALEARAAREIRPLMEITALGEAPPHVVGLVNLRGKVTPVVDLNVRLGRPRDRYYVSDSVIMVGDAFTQFGVIVNEVHDVIVVHPHEIEASPLAGSSTEARSRLVTEVAKVGSDVIPVLNHEELLENSDLEDQASVGGDLSQTGTTTGYFCPEAEPEERTVFQERARLALQSPVDEGFAGLTPIAVVGLNDEYFGMDLEPVREFAALGTVTPIPCCPAHIVGDMNLRGNILTLVDIRGLLGMSPAKLSATGTVIVTALEDLTAGVVVDEVFEIIYILPSDIRPIPSAVQENGEKYLKGALPYAGKMMTILNLANILLSEALSVAEEV